MNLPNVTAWRYPSLGWHTGFARSVSHSCLRLNRAEYPDGWHVCGASRSGALSCHEMHDRGNPHRHDQASQRHWVQAASVPRPDLRADDRTAGDNRRWGPLLGGGADEEATRDHVTT